MAELLGWFILAVIVVQQFNHLRKLVVNNTIAQ